MTDQSDRGRQGLREHPRRISSRATFLYKRILPIAGLGFLSLFIVVPLVEWRSGRPPPASALIGPVFTGVIGYFLIKKLVLDLVDEVLDAGDALIIRNRDQEERVALSDIMNVSYTSFMNPPRVTLLLRRPSAFGTEISFCAPMRLMPFGTTPMINELIHRIDAKRRSMT